MNIEINRKIGLFIPCYIDQFYPQVGIATLELLQKLEMDVTLSTEADLLRPATGQ